MFTYLQHSSTHLSITIRFSRYLRAAGVQCDGAELQWMFADAAVVQRWGDCVVANVVPGCNLLMVSFAACKQLLQQSRERMEGAVGAGVRGWLLHAASG
jgi:hypothetical protein